MRRAMCAISSGVVALGLLTWVLVAPDALIRYPDDLDETLTYRGLVAVPDAPGATTAAETNMSITRHIWVASSTSRTATIREDITTRFGTDVHKQENGYVIDRRTMKIQSGPGNFAFTRDNAVSRPNSYGPNLPMNLDPSGKYRLWSDDTGTAYNVVGDGTTEQVDGVETSLLNTSVPSRPITAAYAKFLGLPTSTTLASLATVVNIDLKNVLDTLAGVVSPITMAELAGAIAAPIPLRYSLQSTGQVSVEPRTGAIVDIRNVAHRLGVSPALEALRLDTILSAYAQDPVVRTVLAQFDELSARPAQTAMSMRYSQTPASVQSAVAVARGLGNDVRRVTVEVPWALAALALLLLVGALIPRRGKPGGLHLLHRHEAQERHAA